MKLSSTVILTALALGAAAAACGGKSAGGNRAQVPIPTQSADAGSEAGPPVPTRTSHDSSGQNGPRDARALLGEVAAIMPADPDMVILVNTAVVRAHPLHEPFGRLVTAVLNGWDNFIPFAVVDPIRDVDWVVMSGSLLYGSTQKNVIVARHNLSPATADAAALLLGKRLPNARTVAEGGHSTLVATIDGADRAFERPKPGVLAIVPAKEGKRAFEHLQRVEVPASVRPGELLRLIYFRHVGTAGAMPQEMQAIRAWVEPGRRADLVLAAEGDCADEQTARVALGSLEQSLASLSTSMAARIAFGPILERAAVWVDGKMVRFQVSVEEQELQSLAAFACIAHPPCRAN